MSKLGPKCQYFVWPPLFSSTALTLLGMEFTRASQVATGVLFHSSMTTSRSWWMLETLHSSTFHLRMAHRCSIGFRSGECLASPSPLPSASLARQWSFWRRVWGRYHVGILPCGHSLWREGIMLCFSMSQYMLAFMVPSMNCSSAVPASTHAAPDHDTPTTMLDCRQDTLVFVLSPGCPPHTLDTIWTK